VTASRFRGCGRELHEDGDRLCCGACGEARTSAVRLDGEPVGAGDGREAFVSPGLLREGLGLRQETLDRASADNFMPPAGATRWARR
jgi:hypothetical protein